MSDAGWVKIHRKIMNSSVWSDPLRLKAWLHCVLSANHEDNEIFRNGNVVKVKKGQFITSNRRLQEEWGCSTNTVKKILNQFTELDMIRYSTETRRYTVITLINYGVYQDRVYSERDTERDTERDSERDTERDTEREQTRIYKNYKNDKEDIYTASPDEDDYPYGDDEDDEEGFVIPQQDENGNWIVPPEWDYSGLND